MKDRLIQEWAVASFFDELESGYEFDRADIPLHATIAGVFTADAKSLKLSSIVEDLVKDMRSFSIMGADNEEWGDVVVAKLEPSRDLRHLIDTVQGGLVREGAEFNEPQFLGQGFTPHVTVQKTSALEVGEKVAVASVSLVDMLPSDDGQRRRVAANFHLWQHRH